MRLPVQELGGLVQRREQEPERVQELELALVLEPAEVLYGHIDPEPEREPVSFRSPRRRRCSRMRRLLCSALRFR